MNRIRPYIRKSQMLSFEKVEYIGFGWDRFEYIRSTFMSNLPSGSYVYCILVNNGNEERLVYVGCTKNLQSRFLTHTKLGSLYMNKKKNRIFILIRQFSENHYENAKWECKLILEHSPALNRHNKDSNEKIFSETDMWNFLKIKKVNTGRDLMKIMMEENRLKSLKKWQDKIYNGKTN